MDTSRKGGGVPEKQEDVEHCIFEIINITI